MKNLIKKHLLLTTIIVAIIVCNIPVIAQTANKQLTLRYKFPEDRSVTYKQTSKIMQTMDIEGQQMQNEINSLFGCSVKSAGGSGPDLALEVRVDTIAQSVESPMGASGGGVSGISGKIFKMVITPLGKEALSEWLANHQYSTIYRDELLLKLFVSHREDYPALLKDLKNVLNDLLAQGQIYSEIKETVLTKVNNLSFDLALDYGIMQNEVTVEWLKKSIKIIEEAL